MKKKIPYLILVGMLVMIFTGCSGISPEAVTEIPTVSELESGADKTELESILGQGNLVDDSYTFTRENPEEDGYTYIEDYMADKVLPQYLDSWTENCEIIDCMVAPVCNSSKGYVFSGWVLFRGTPNKQTGWEPLNGEDLYCRAFQAYCDDKRHYSVDRSQAGVPLKTLDARTLYNSPAAIYGVNGEPTTFPGLHLKNAELYVTSLGKSFIIDDANKLLRLEKALEPIQERGNVPAHDSDGWNPMVLTMEDGKSYLVNTISDGFPATDIWGGQLIPLNLYALFDVPLEPSGFTLDESGNTVLHLDRLTRTYSPTGLLLEEAQERQMDNGNMDLYITRYRYCEDEKLSQITELVGQQIKYVTDYEYNEKGLLVKEIMGNPEELRPFNLYEYDHLDRLTAVIAYNPDGTPAENTTNTYYWYEENGSQHFYIMHTDGTFISGDAPPMPVRRETAK